MEIIIMNRKGSKPKPLLEIINGFRIIKDLGQVIGPNAKKSERRALVECKVCHRHYESNPLRLKSRKHCGCIKNNRIVVND